MLPVMQVGRVRPGAPPEHDVLHPVGGGLGQARPTNNIGIHRAPGSANTEAGAMVGRVPSRGTRSRIQAQDERSGQGAATSVRLTWRGIRLSPPGGR
ncbi:MAG: hypothetical protein FJ404_13825 [Verrucomicrobia bacterium]|nr:hypothetical protein [Verrucomicrobiota bacterium]